MKVKYLSTLAAIATLTLGLTVSCANPCGAKTKGTDTTESQSDPCAGKTADPCAGKAADPCAGR
ncbi:MAG: hypothetical protein ACLFV6_14245 [Spirulinaceae cyanobacterium]